MKRLLFLFCCTTTIVLAQTSTIDQIRAKIQETNNLLLSIPEIKSLLEEQARLYKQKIDLEDAIGITDLNKQSAQREGQITLAREREIGAQLKSLKEQYNVTHDFSLAEKINTLDTIYREQISQNINDRMNKINKLSSSQYQNILQKLEELREEITQKLNAQERNLFIKLSQQSNQLKQKLMREIPYNWKDTIENLEKGSVLKSRFGPYDWSLRVFDY